MTPPSEEEDDDLFGDHGKLSYTADTPWKEFAGQILETQSPTLKDNMLEKITNMLRTFGQVSGKERTIAQRTKPVKDPDGKDKVFIPAKFRIKPTITQTDEFIGDLQLKHLSRRAENKMKKKWSAERFWTFVLGSGREY